MPGAHIREVRLDIRPHRRTPQPPARRHQRLRGLAAGVCLLPGLAMAAPASYALDPVHTRVLFSVSHAGFSQALGTVSGSTGTLLFDPDDWSSARLSVSVPLARLDLGDAKWNQAVSARGLLDVAEHPVATFVSTRIEPQDAQHARVCGTLTLRGVAGETCLDVTFNQLRRHPLPPFRRTAGFSATATLSRQAFGIDAWPTVIGDTVQLRIEAEAARSHAAGETEAAPPSAQTAAPATPTEVPAATTTAPPAPTDLPEAPPVPEPPSEPTLP